MQRSHVKRVGLERSPVGRLGRIHLDQAARSQPAVNIDNYLNLPRRPRQQCPQVPLHRPRTEGAAIGGRDKGRACRQRKRQRRFRRIRPTGISEAQRVGHAATCGNRVLVCINSQPQRCTGFDPQCPRLADEVTVIRQHRHIPVNQKPAGQTGLGDGRQIQRAGLTRRQIAKIPEGNLPGIALRRAADTTLTIGQTRQQGFIGSIYACRKLQPQLPAHIAGVLHFLTTGT